ncbi:CLIC2 [Lepeophtheirus salmonis]|uniref:CLIC2 n=1 Tax=Lepeophtheirus salmonis TaxID=72036 RepID=A0A7R8H9D0_LEPSM|nr:CLIC2 [Lepeophtheirus salmonis]CAF2939106.1 CLIC2 [Lepeophtheirus salmonis]
MKTLNGYNVTTIRALNKKLEDKIQEVKGKGCKQSTNLLKMDENSSNIPEIELIVKASTIDGRRKGACLFCQEYFMDLYLLAELQKISLKITTVDMKRPPPDFRSNFEATRPPILLDSGIAILENEKIERHIMKKNPGFKHMILRQDELSIKAVNNILSKIDDELSTRGSRFLTGDTLCCFDTELMPRLQHLRIAGKFFLNYEIPSEYTSLWKYIREMYELDAFTQSCPADQDIIHIYKLQQPRNMTSMQKKSHEELEEPTYSLTLPESI